MISPCKYCNRDCSGSVEGVLVVGIHSRELHIGTYKLGQPEVTQTYIALKGHSFYGGLISQVIVVLLLSELIIKCFNGIRKGTYKSIHFTFIVVLAKSILYSCQGIGEAS